jgi:nucleotide-binding universal stress UspA family protein
MYLSILVPLDGSHTATLALAHAKALAKKFGSTIHLVRAVHTISELAQGATPALGKSAAMSQDVVSRQEAAGELDEARHYLQARLNELQTDGIVAEVRVRSGPPAGEILEAARSSGAELIVLTAYGAGGAHTRSPGAVYGGVADEVLRESRIPMLLVRP